MKRKIARVLVFFLVGCAGFKVKEKIIGNYYLVATDEEAQMSLTYCEPGENGCGDIVQETVFAIGFNEHYIIAKQHPRNFPDPPNMAVTNYYILSIDSAFDWRNQKNLAGPMNLHDYLMKRKEWKMPDSVQFSIVKERLR